MIKETKKTEEEEDMEAEVSLKKVDIDIGSRRKFVNVRRRHGNRQQGEEKRGKDVNREETQVGRRKAMVALSRGEEGRTRRKGEQTRTEVK